MASAGTGDIAAGLSVNNMPRSLTAQCSGLQSPGISLISALLLVLILMHFIPSSTQMCCPASLFPFPTVVIKASQLATLQSPCPLSCSSLVCRWKKENRIRKIYHQQLKANWAWDLFSHFLKTMQANANGIQSTWRAGKTWSSTRSGFQKGWCKDKGKSERLPASPKAISSHGWLAEASEYGIYQYMNMQLRQSKYGFLSRNTSQKWCYGISLVM